MKSKSKSELADMAGVSVRTLRRWMLQHDEQMARLGVSKTSKVIPPHAVRYICKEYGIDL